jgi:hypothetical protein
LRIKRKSARSVLSFSFRNPHSAIRNRHCLWRAI